MDKQQLEAILNNDEMAETARLLAAAQKHTVTSTKQVRETL